MKSKSGLRRKKKKNQSNHDSGNNNNNNNNKNDKSDNNEKGKKEKTQGAKMKKLLSITSLFRKEDKKKDKKKKKKKIDKNYVYDDCHLCERYYYYLPNGEKSCKFTIWDTVGDIRFSNNIIYCIERSDIVIAIHDFTLESSKFIRKVDNEISERIEIEIERCKEKQKEKDKEKEDEKEEKKEKDNKLNINKMKLIVLAINDNEQDDRYMGNEAGVAEPSVTATVGTIATRATHASTPAPVSARAGDMDEFGGMNNLNKRKKPNAISNSSNIKIYMNYDNGLNNLKNFEVINDKFLQSRYGKKRSKKKMKNTSKPQSPATSNLPSTQLQSRNGTESTIQINGGSDDHLSVHINNNHHHHIHHDNNNDDDGIVTDFYETDRESDSENERKIHLDASHMSVTGITEEHDVAMTSGGHRDLIPPLKTNDDANGKAGKVRYEIVNPMTILTKKEGRIKYRVERLFQWIAIGGSDAIKGDRNATHDGFHGNDGSGEISQCLKWFRKCVRYHCREVLTHNKNGTHLKHIWLDSDGNGDIGIAVDGLSGTTTMRKYSKHAAMTTNVKKEMGLHKSKKGKNGKNGKRGNNDKHSAAAFVSINSINAPIRTKEIITIETDSDTHGYTRDIATSGRSAITPHSLMVGKSGKVSTAAGGDIKNRWMDAFSPSNDNNNNLNDNKNDKSHKKQEGTINKVKVYWGLLRRQSERPCGCDQFTQTIKQFIVCLSFGLSAPIILVMQTIIIWSYSDTNQMLSNKFITDTLDLINIKINDFAIFKYDALFSFLPSHYPDPSYRAFIYTMAQNEHDTRLKQNTPFNYGLLLRQPTKQKVDRLFVALLLAVLTTMSMYNLICYFYFYQNSDDDDNKFLSKFELLSAPIWLSVISSMVASFYSYHVSVHPSMNSNQATKEAETMLLSYIAYRTGYRYKEKSKVEQKIKQKITLTVKMFLKNYQNYHDQIRNSSRFFKRKSSLVSIILAIGIATVPGIVRQFKNSANFFENASVYEQLAASVGWCLNCVFAIMAQYVFDMIFFTKVKDYARLTETITSLIEIPETVDADEGGDLGSLNTCLACCGVGGDLTDTSDVDFGTGGSSSDDYGCCSCSSCSLSCNSKGTMSRCWKRSFGNEMEAEIEAAADKDEDGDKDAYGMYIDDTDSEEDEIEEKKLNEDDEQDGNESYLNKQFGLGLVSLDDPTNLLSWMELRDNVCIKGIKIFGDLELFVLCIALWMIALSAWLCIELLTRSSSSDVIGETFVSVAFLYVMSVLWIFNVFFLGSKFDRLQIRQIRAIRNQMDCISFETMHYRNLECVGPKSWEDYKCGEWNELITMQRMSKCNVNSEQFYQLLLKRDELDCHIRTMKYCIEKLESYPINPQIFGIGLTATLTKSLVGSVVLPIISYIISQYI